MYSKIDEFMVAKMLLIFFSILSIQSFITANAQIQPSHTDFNFVAAGDWGCNEMAQRTVNNMQNKSPSLVLALGDFSYEKNGGCWLKMMSPLINKTRIVIGEHDFDENNYTRLENYVNRFNLSDPFYSFNYGNIHFLALSSIIPFNNQSLQFKVLRDDSRQKEFVSNDLYTASQNKSINWIVVYVYRPMYTSPTFHPPRESLRDSYHPLFDMYGVDLVLQAHNHNYQRSYPLRFNATNSSIPKIADTHVDAYDNPNGTIFMTVGTAGAVQYNFTGQAPYTVKQFNRFGFLNINIIDNGTKMAGTFFDNRDGADKDHFTINK
ncbi:MAG: metallophosphoesterase [Nitrososphaerota archaeon]